MTPRHPSLLHKIDVPALRSVVGALVQALDRIGAIKTESSTVQRELDLTSTILHLRIKKAEKALTKAIEQGDEHE
jgi:hypothetical protein